MDRHECVSCGGSLVDGEFCPHCGARQPRAIAVDPFVGRVVADRYDVVELLREGGMSRVYRATQRSLDRPVALKIVEPTKLPGVFTEEVVTRFMREARTASQLNHPNVVSIFDFGRTTFNDEPVLFLAMEMLAGPSLGQLIANGEPLALDRISEILHFTLAALGEAHQSGITHRDVKPDNIVFDRDRVKVIDFGIARVEQARRLTDAGRVMGTPHYVAPEQVTGITGPSVDLYAVGIILFELLAGRVPFDAKSAVEVVRLHTCAPRPDPRLFAKREIPPALADVCMRAMAIDPAERYPDAEALAQAIAQATSQGWTVQHSSLFPAASSRRDATTEAPPAIPIPMPSQPMISDGPALIGREGHVAWACAQLAKPAGLSAIVLWGEAGMGKTRILAELAGCAREIGAGVIEVGVEPAPRSEIGFAYARSLIAKLGADAAYAPSDSSQGRREMASAIRVAAREAVKHAGGALVVAAMDDVDRADGVSRALVEELLADEPIPGFVMLMTRSSEPDTHSSVRQMRLTGLSRVDARRLVSRSSATSTTTSSAARGTERLVEPLYLEQFLRWRAERRNATSTGATPATLPALVEERIHALTPPQRRALQAVAVVGGGTVAQIEALIEREEETSSALASLADAGFLRREGESFALAHAIFGSVALRDAPAGAIERLHARAADALQGDEGAHELRAWHAIRGDAGFEAFALVEEAARVRAARGDAAGAVASLFDGYAATRTCMARLDERAASAAWIVFGRKLADALVHRGQLVEARGILSELLQATAPRDAARAPIVETLARIAEQSGRDDEAARLRGEVRESGLVPASIPARDSGVEPTTATRRRQIKDETAPPSSRGKRRKIMKR